MRKEEILKLVDSFQKKADTAYQNYQETGIGRYDSARRRNSDIADALRIAVNASDDHTALLELRAAMCNFAFRAAKATSQFQSEATKAELAAALARDIAAYGRAMGLIAKE